MICCEKDYYKFNWLQYLKGYQYVYALVHILK